MTTYLPYTLTLRAPAIVTALSGDPNSAATQPFIPGGAIRGAVAARLIAEGKPAEGALFRDLVLSGVVRYLHAYPIIDGQRSLPAPRSWRRDKAGPDWVRDLAAFDGHVTEDDDAEDLEDHWPEEALISLGAPFVTPALGAGRRRVVAPRIKARLHQQRDRAKGRPWTRKEDGQEERRGEIFAYEYLEAGQVFRGVVQVHLHGATPGDATRAAASTEHYIEQVRSLIGGRAILVGRSRRAGYGGDAEIRFDTVETTAEYPNVPGALSADLEAGERFRMLFASAYMGRHPVSGQLGPEALSQELHERGLHVDIGRRCWSFETVGSFNRKWRLAVPQAAAAAAGSVFVLRAQEPIGRGLLQDIVRNGLGERRTEGFGRVLFLQHDEDTDPFRVHPDEDSSVVVGHADPIPAAVEGPQPDAFAFLERRIVLSAAQRELDRVATDLASPRRAPQPPTTSLLGRVRTLFRAVRDEATAREAQNRLHTWCADEGEHALKREARDKLNACQLGDTSLLAWLQALAEPLPESGAWERLVTLAGAPSTLSALAQRHHLTTSQAAEEVLEAHAGRLTVHLADGVLAAMARRNRGSDR